MATAAARWSGILEEASASELSMREFARSRGLNPNTLAWWKWRLGREERATGFVEVVVEDREPSSLCVEVGSARVYVDKHSDLQLLRQVVEALA